jgi:hypothetical protein
MLVVLPLAGGFAGDADADAEYPAVAALSKSLQARLLAGNLGRARGETAGNSP